MSEALQRATERRGDQGVAIALAVAMVVVVGWTIVRGPMGATESLAFRTGAALGAGLVQAGVVWGALWLFSLRHKAGVRAGGYFLVLFGLAVFMNLLVEVGGGAAEQRRQAGVAKAELAGAARDLLAGGEGIDATPKAAGKAGLVEAWTKRFWATLAEDQNRYQAEANALGLDHIFEGEALRADPKLVEARRKVAAAEALVDKYEALSWRHIDEARAEALKLDVSDHERREIVAGFDQGRARGEAKLKRKWALDHAIVAGLSEMVETAVRTQGHWGVQDGRIAFDRAEDLAVFNAQAARLDKLIAEQQTLQREERARLSNLAQEMADGG